MRIAILIPTLKPGGAEKQAALLASILSDENDVNVISLWGKKNLSPFIKEILDDSHVRVHYLSGKSLYKWIEFYKLLKKYHIEVAFNYLTSSNVIGSVIEKMVRVKIVFNGIRNSRLTPIKTILEWFAHNFIADYTIYNCQSGAEHFEKLGFRKNKTIVIHNCFPNISQPVKRTDKDIKIIITVGRFEAQKDYLTAIKSIAELRKKRKDFIYNIVGHGSLENRVREWVKEYEISDCTNIFIAPNNVQEILRSADIYLSTSLFEGTSNSIMEAMNWSIPIVATNVGDNSILVKHNESGYLSEIGDVVSLSQNMEQLLSSYQKRLCMGLRGNSMLHTFSQENFRKRYCELLNKM